MRKVLRFILLWALVLICPQLARASCTTSTNMGYSLCPFGTPGWDVFTNANWALADFNFQTPLSRSGVNVSLTTVPYTLGGTSFTGYAKGDLLVGLASGALAKQAVGADGKVLVADSSQTNGVAWKASVFPPFADDLALLKDDSDNTKKLRFSLGGLTTATTRVLTPKDRDGTIADLGDNTFTSDQTIADQHEIRLREAIANGSNYTGFRAPSSLAGNVIYDLPAADGTADQVLKTDGSKHLAWVDPSGGGGSSKTMVVMPCAILMDEGQFCGPGDATTNLGSTMIFPFGGTVKNLHCHVNAAPSSGGSQTIDFFYHLNGSFPTTVCQIGDDEVACSDTSNTVAVVAGDEFNIANSPSATAASTSGSCTFELDPS